MSVSGIWISVFNILVLKLKNNRPVSFQMSNLYLNKNIYCLRNVVVYCVQR